MKRLGIIGAGDLGQTLARHAPRSGEYEVAGFFDDTREPLSETPGGRVLGPVSALDDDAWKARIDAVIVAVGYKHPEFRRRCFEHLSARFESASLVHESCYVDPSATIAPGAVLFPGCVIDAGSTVGLNVLLNTGCVIAHDTKIGAHSFLGPAVALAGFVTIGESCFLGIRTTVIDNRALADGVQTGGGAVVTEDLTEAGLYVGVPARRVR